MPDKTTPAEGPDYKALCDSLKAQQDQIDQCRIALERLASASAMESYVQNGIVQVCQLLEPLQLIAPQRTPLDKADAERFMKLREAMKRPDYSAFGELPISGCEPGYRADRHQSRSIAP
jgi:hypothetical protein